MKREPKADEAGPLLGEFIGEEDGLLIFFLDERYICPSLNLAAATEKQLRAAIRRERRRDRR